MILKGVITIRLKTIIKNLIKSLTSDENIDKKSITATDQQEVEYIRAKLILAANRLKKEGYRKHSVTGIMKNVLKRKRIDDKL